MEQPFWLRHFPGKLKVESWVFFVAHHFDNQVDTSISHRNFFVVYFLYAKQFLQRLSHFFSCNLTRSRKTTSMINSYMCICAHLGCIFMVPLPRLNAHTTSRISNQHHQTRVFSLIEAIYISHHVRRTPIVKSSQIQRVCMCINQSKTINGCTSV